MANEVFLYDYETCQLTKDERDAILLSVNVNGPARRDVRAVLTGEYRYPKKGEWFLREDSGDGRVVAVRFTSDRAYSAKAIARLVPVKVVETYEPILEPKGSEALS